MAEEPDGITSLPPGRSYSDDARLADYLIVGWRYRLVILLLTIAGGAAGWFASRAQPVSYEATAIVALVPGPAGQPGAMSAADLQALFRGKALIAGVLRDTGFDKPPDNLTATDVAANRLRIEIGPETNRVNIHAWMDRPDKAITLVNQLVRQAVAARVETVQAETAAERARVHAELQKAEIHFDDVGARMARLQAARKAEPVQSGLGQLSADRGDLRKVAIDIGAQEAKIVALDVELKRHAGIASMQERLEYRLITERSELAALVERRRRLNEQVRSLSSERVLVSLYAQESQLARERAEYSAAQSRYAGLAPEYRRLQDDVIGTPQLRVVDQAVPPLAPMPRGTMRRMVSGFVIGLLAGMFVALALNYLNAVKVRLEKV